jgi:hypothetical protein
MPAKSNETTFRYSNAIYGLTLSSAHLTLRIEPKLKDQINKNTEGVHFTNRFINFAFYFLREKNYAP